MSTGELVPERAREGLARAAAQLPWDIYLDVGNVYLAVLLQDTGWVVPRNLSVSHELAEEQVRREIDRDVDPPDPPLDLRYA